jgi:hypothetical protein
MEAMKFHGIVGPCQPASHHYAVIAYTVFAVLGLIKDKRRNLVA